MKKGSLIILAAVIILSFITWFSCNPIVTAPVSQSYDVLDESAPVRATTVITTFSELQSAVGTAGSYTISGTISCTSAIKLASNVSLTGGCLDFSSVSSYGITIANSGCTLDGVELKNCGDTVLYITGSNNTFKNLNLHNNKDFAVCVRHGGANNKFTSCYSHDNADTANNGENADGFGLKWEGGSGNSFTNCIATSNSDDGWDLWMYTSTVTFSGCTANSNGAGSSGDGNGFKLGGNSVSCSHTLSNCVANNNTGYGYTGNSNPAHMNITNCTGSGNKKGLMDRIN
jgi:hypothetical protein